MKKSISAIALATVILLSGCDRSANSTSSDNSESTPSGANNASTENTASPANTESEDDWFHFNPEVPEGAELLGGNVYVAYDKTPYQNVTVDKCYYWEMLPVTEDMMYDLFDGTPETSDHLGNVTYTLGNISARYNGAESGDFLLWTERGSDMSHRAYWRAYCNLSIQPMVSLVGELDFMSREEVTAEIKKQLGKYCDSDFDMRLYAVSREGYLWLGEQAYGDNFEPVEDPTDFYYALVYPSIDGIPMSAFSTRYDPQTSASPVYYEILYTEEGLEYLHVSYPCSIGEAVPAEGEFISVDEAENLLKEMLASDFREIPLTFVQIELVYAPVLTDDGRTLLTPAWAFYTQDGVGVTVAINALTGKQLDIMSFKKRPVITEIR